MLPLISIIVPIYNVERYLPQCIESLLGQTYSNIEIILVDDGSTDNCSEICDSYAERDKRIIVIHKENGGQDSARKAGILSSTGEYIGYVDGDDWINSDMYEKLITLALKYDVDVVESGVIDSWEDKYAERKPFILTGCYKGKEFNEKVSPFMIYSGSFFKHGVFPYLVSKLFKKRSIIKYQLLDEPTNNLADDIMCTFPCIYNSKSLYVTHDCFYHYRVRSDSTKRNIRNDIYQIVKSNYNNWLSRFEITDNDNNIKKQLQFFILYLFLAKAIYVFDKSDDNYILKPFGSIDKKKKIVLYGAGTMGIHLKKYFDNIGYKNLVMWADKNYEHIQSDVIISDPAKICTQDYDYVILSILNADAANSAKTELLNMGIPNEKILWIKDEYVNDPEKLLSELL